MASVFLQSAAVPVVLALVLTWALRASASFYLAGAAFSSGVLGAFSINQLLLRQIPSVLPEGAIHPATAMEAWLSGFIEAALPEEFAKGVWALVVLWGWRRFSRNHGALVGGLIGLGFALRENLSYAQTVPEWRVVAALSHACWGVLLGSLLDRALESRVGTLSRLGRVALAFIPPVALHGLIDSSIFMVEVHEARTGLRPENLDPSALLHPVLLSAMALTIAVEIISVGSAILIIRRVRSSNLAQRANEMPRSATCDRNEAC